VKNLYPWTHIVDHVTTISTHVWLFFTLYYFNPVCNTNYYKYEILLKKHQTYNT
jgi:hypothetical protein